MLYPPKVFSYCCFLLFSFFLFFTKQTSAQLAVNLSSERSLYIAYEPLILTTSIKNFSATPCLLADDSDACHWFTLSIETLDGTPIPPNDPHYEMSPLNIRAGDTCASRINITSLFPINNFGSYQIRATIYVAELHRYFTSPPLTIEITEGRLLSQQAVGAPITDQNKTATRTISLLSHRLPEETKLYLRIEDKEAGIVFCTHCLGSFMPYKKPEILLDAKNHVHVLQNETPGSFIYSHVDLGGKIIDRKKFISTKSSTSLLLTKEGIVTVVDGMLFDANAAPSAEPSLKPYKQPPSPSSVATKNKKKKKI